MLKTILVFLFLFCAASFLGALDFKLLKTYTGACAPKSVDVAPDGSYAAVMNLEGMDVWLIDTKTLRIKQKISFTRTPAKGWDYDRHRPIDSFAEKPVECDFGEGGRYLWISFHNGACVIRYDVFRQDTNKTKQMQKVFVKDYDAGGSNYTVYVPKIPVGTTPKVVRVSPDQRFTLVANWHSSSVSIIDNATLKVVKTVTLGGGEFIPRGICITSDSKTAYIANMGGGTVSIIDLEALKLRKDIPFTSNPRHIIITKDDKYLLVSDNASGCVLKYDLELQKIVKSVSVGRMARTIAETPDEKYIICAVNGSDRLAVIDAESFKVVRYIAMTQPMGVSVTPDGTQLWATSYTGEGYVNVYSIAY